MITYPFSQEEAIDAAERWNFNCGPAALAFALGLKPRDAIEPDDRSGAKRRARQTVRRIGGEVCAAFAARSWRLDVVGFCRWRRYPQVLWPP